MLSKCLAKRKCFQRKMWEEAPHAKLTDVALFGLTRGLSRWRQQQRIHLMQETQETRAQSLAREDPLQKGIHSSILAWRITQAEETGGLQRVFPWAAKSLMWLSMRARAHTHTHTHTHTHGTDSYTQPGSQSCSRPPRKPPCGSGDGSSKTSASTCPHGC